MLQRWRELPLISLGHSQVNRTPLVQVNASYAAVASAISRSTSVSSVAITVTVASV